MLNRMGRLAAAPTSITNAASFYTTATAPATNVQSAIMAGVDPAQWNAMTPQQQQDALVQATASPIGPSPAGPGLVAFGGPLLTIGGNGAGAGGGFTPGQIQRAVNAGLTPSQFSRLPPQQQRTAGAGALNASIMPWLLIGGVVLLLFASKKER